MNCVVKTVETMNGDLRRYLNEYKYSPTFTARLDGLKMPLDQHTINEIVLWKVNRYVELESGILNALNATTDLRPGEHRESEGVLAQLLETRGVDLAMASTFLRFRNPDVFQIVDRHAYRAIYGVKYPLTTKSTVKRKVALYFEYLDRLTDLCRCRGFEFKTIDRLLYIFDKNENRQLD
jgi:thermostable 8-oxoguanine DNA glycosylase